MRSRTFLVVLFTTYRSQSEATGECVLFSSTDVEELDYDNIVLGETTPSSSHTLRERCGITFFISFARPNFGGPPNGHLEPRVNNLPRRWKTKPAAVDNDPKEFEFFASS